MLLDDLSVKQRKALRRLWEIIPQARLVGGTVRDLLLGQATGDLDLASPLTPQALVEKMAHYRVKTIPTGISHGTILVIIDGVGCEVTTLRRDVTTDGRHADVAFTDNWQLDAQRRDFTINALYLDKDGNIYDYFDGKNDLKKGIVRFVGDPAKRIEEDGLRILRFFRFYARFSRVNMPDKVTLDAIINKHSMMTRLSVERIRRELFLLFEAPHLKQALLLMEKTGILAEIFNDHYQLTYILRLIEYGAPRKPLLFLSCLSKEPLSLAKSFKLSRQESYFIKMLMQQDPVEIDISKKEDLRVLLACFGEKIALCRMWRHFSQRAHSCKEVNDFKKICDDLSACACPKFPLAGRDIMKMGVKPGPQLGRILGNVKLWWLQNRCFPSLGECYDFASQLVDLPKKEEVTLS